MKYLDDNEIRSLSDDEKLNALNIIDFEAISEQICEYCNKRDDCQGYFSGSCICWSEWGDILTNLVKAEQDLSITLKHVQAQGEKNYLNPSPLTCIKVTESGMFNVPYYG